MTTAVKEDPAVADREEVGTEAWRKPPPEGREAEYRDRDEHADRVEREAEARWKINVRRLNNDTNMDDRRKAAYLDRTLITIGDGATILGVSTHRISQARGGRRTAGRVQLPQRRWPHPSVYPPPARVREWIAGKPVYLWFRGEVIAWAERRGLNLLNLETGDLIKLRNRSGRPRSERTTRSKQHIPGTPRKNKKTKPVNTDE